MSAIHLSNNPIFHERSKHIEMDCHFIREKIKEGLIKPIYLKTQEQIVDIFTKALHPSQFHILLNKMSILNIHASLEGECEIEQ